MFVCGQTSRSANIIRTAIPFGRLRRPNDSSEMMKLIPQLPELNDYAPTAAVQSRGPIATCLVKSLHSAQTGMAEWLDVGETSEELFSRVRQLWQNNVHRQPAGSLQQREFHDKGQRLTRVIDLPSGRPLKEWIFTQRFDFTDALATVISLTECLADWHQMSRVHGWISGESVFRDSQNQIELRDPSVLDVHAQEDFLSLANRDVVFLSPESSGSLARDISPASDLYSVGAVLFGMLAGRPPIEATDASDYLDRQLRFEAPRLRELGLNIPRALDDLVARLLRRDPRDRYESATALLFDLQHIAGSKNASHAIKPFAIGTHDIRRTLTEATLVGREDEIQTMQQAIRDAREGDLRLQVIAGADAMCRRNLVDEIALLAKSQGMYVFRGGASTTTNPKPLQSLETTLSTIVTLCSSDHDLAARVAASSREHAATLSDLMPALASLWPAFEGQTGPDAYGSQRAAIALEELFVAFAKEPRGVTFLFDDLDLADELTRTVVRSLADRVKKEPGHSLLCVVTGDSPQALNFSANCPTIRLQPISSAAVELHLQSTAGKLSDSITRSIIDVADGSAMMASAILGRMIDTGVVKPSMQGWVSDGLLIEALRGDESFAEQLEQQIGALSETALQILSTAAVVGQRFDLAMLIHVAGARYAEVLEVATDALGRKLLWRDARPGWFRFAHDQIHQQLCAARRDRAATIAPQNRCLFGTERSDECLRPGFSLRCRGPRRSGTEPFARSRLPGPPTILARGCSRST